MKFIKKNFLLNYIYFQINIISQDNQFNPNK